TTVRLAISDMTDIRQAEANLRAANANVGAAKASFFPAIGLTALFGAQSPELNQLVKGRTMIWNTGGTLQGPVFQGGQLVGQFRAQKAIWEQAKLAYQSAALQAFGEVATLLNAHLKLEQSRVQQSRSVESLRKAVALSLRRYELGIANYTEVLDAQQLLFPAENQLVNIRLQQYTTLVQLYMALGGGWQLAP
ncbi:MAG: TolC family protein, partial [bacterium]